MVDPYQTCPLNSVFPQVFGFNGDAPNWNYGETSDRVTKFVDVTYNTKYIVTGGYTSWMSAQFLPTEDFKVIECNGQNCDTFADDGTMSGYSWKRGFLHLYEDQDFKKRKYYILGAADKNV